ncbi:arylsulfatase [Psychrosphaera sp. B3R10]|uniref:sulfatase family protein n=1 Tax=unclassified Psychrosphaera TaxID=2641570 RepID=UPI001C092E01|nr:MULTISPECIES: arylsulfatase [unclassified Psychrosphaera]MBU2881231.1 arylsulfatase [Psychrosphaera sp. I2R16]MBU2990074.1 arylsulfatase [Psychrosphaera sp. B3R10]
MNSLKLLANFAGLCLLVACSNNEISPDKIEPSSNKPNIVIFYVDDLGWGDLSSYGATAVQTPNVDALANNGIRFTDAHSSAATCTPSRYSLLTGEHAFRKNVRILKGDAAMVIAPEQPTLPKMLQTEGYKTAVVGKWHLGLGDGVTPINWNKNVTPGPLEIGFDYSFLLPATGDRVPSVYLENHNVLNLTPNDPLFVDYTKKIGNRPTGYEHPELLRQGADSQHNKTIINGISRIGWMQGGKSAEWVDEDFPFVTTQKANDFISKNKSQPFFLFFSFHDIHVPRLPNKMFEGATNMGVRGDAIVQMDWITGQVVNHLKKLDMLENTLIIFTSDNGAVLTDGYNDNALTRIGEHLPNGPYSGGKYSILEGGTRVPFIVHYPNKVKQGLSHALFSQIDLYASIAALLNINLKNNEAIDSVNHLGPLFDAALPARTTLAEETPHTEGLRSGNWKYIRPVKKVNSWIKANKNIDSGLAKSPQLFNLISDPAEEHNLAQQYPNIVKELEQQLKLIEQKRTRN